eukprot:m.263150 g.263150  ORF g.263150 m.263150 type:complete len:239 (-) comp51963_c0_seq1:1150-1866(-)
MTPPSLASSALRPTSPASPSPTPAASISHRHRRVTSPELATQLFPSTPTTPSNQRHASLRRYTTHHHATQRPGSDSTKRHEENTEGDIPQAKDDDCEAKEAAVLTAWFAGTSDWHRLIVLRHLLSFVEVRSIQPVLDYISTQSRLMTEGESASGKCDMISNLPSPLAKYILSFLEFSDLMKAAQVSPKWKLLARQVLDDQVGQNVCSSASANVSFHFSCACLITLRGFRSIGKTQGIC